MNYKSYMDLSKTIACNITQLPQDLDLIVGIPRSGLIPALIISSYLNIPVSTLDQFLKKELPRFGFYRTPKKYCISFSEIKKVLIVDDSICSGRNIKNVKEQVASLNFMDLKVLYGAIYYVKGSESLLDIAMEEVPFPRFFQWNIFSHQYFLANACVDIDGVVCDDPTEEDNDDGERYRKFISTAKPRFSMAEGNHISCFVTSRLEKYRPETEAWLKKYFNYNELIMLNLPSKKERVEKRAYASFKSEIYKTRSEILFIESNRMQAIEISKLSNKAVFCTDTMELFDNIDTVPVKSNLSGVNKCILPPPIYDVQSAQKLDYMLRPLKKALKYFLPYAVVRIWQGYKTSLTQAKEPANEVPAASASYCPLCEHTSIFTSCGVDILRPQGGCPICGSMERHRTLFYIYQVLFLTKNTPIKLLHLAPEASLYNLLISRANIDYTCMDLYPKNFPFTSICEKQDALSTTYPDKTFDIILANHLIEHLPEDEFLLEMKRIMRPDGLLILSMPVYWNMPFSFEDVRFSQTREDRKKYFGQDDHIRKYGADVEARLGRFFEVQVIKANDMRPMGDEVNTNIFVLRNHKNA